MNFGALYQHLQLKSFSTQLYFIRNTYPLCYTTILLEISMQCQKKKNKIN